MEQGLIVLTEKLSELTEQVTLLRIDMAGMTTKVNYLWWAFGVCLTGVVGQFSHGVLKRGNHGYKDKTERIVQAIADKLLNGKTPH